MRLISLLFCCTQILACGPQVCEYMDYYIAGVCVKENSFESDPNGVEITVQDMQVVLDSFGLESNDGDPISLIAEFDNINMGFEFVGKSDEFLEYPEHVGRQRGNYAVAWDGSSRCYAYKVMSHELLHIVQRFILGRGGDECVDHETEWMFEQDADRQGIPAELTIESIINQRLNIDWYECTGDAHT